MGGGGGGGGGILCMIYTKHISLKCSEHCFVISNIVWSCHESVNKPIIDMVKVNVTVPHVCSAAGLTLVVPV